MRLCSASIPGDLGSEQLGRRIYPAGAAGNACGQLVVTNQGGGMGAWDAH